METIRGISRRLSVRLITILIYLLFFHSMSKELVLKNKEQIQLLRTMTGEGDANSIRMNVPQIKIDTVDVFEDGKENKNYGGFSIVTSEKNEAGEFSLKKEPLGKTFQAVILKRRYIASHWNKDANATDYYTYEFDKWNEIIPLIHEKKIVEKSTYKQLKEKYGISPSLVLYVLYSDTVYRLKCSSSALFTFGDYEKLFMDSSVSLVITEFSTEKRRVKPGSPWYFVPKFQQVGESENIFDTVKKLNEDINLYETLRDGKQDNEDQGFQDARGFTDAQVMEDEKIKVEDLPFN